jgi:hypothetical protein
VHPGVATAATATQSASIIAAKRAASRVLREPRDRKRRVMPSSTRERAQPRGLHRPTV